MKAMTRGIWRTDAVATPGWRAAAERSGFRHRLSADGASGFAAEAGRYHLYVSYACPFAHRTLLARALVGLEAAVGVSVLDPDWGGPHGWVFNDGPMATPDHVSGLANLPEVYRKAAPRFTGKVTVPALWDRKRGTIVNNESAEIMRMFEVEMRALGTSGIDLYPDELHAEIDRINAFVGPRINGGVYRAGFAATQEAYEAAVVELFAALDELERHLSARRFLVGERLTEADLRLFPTLVRFDIAYYGALRCNLRRLAEYPNLWAYTKRLYHLPGIAATVKLDHVKRHYWDDHEMINRRIVPLGPEVDFGAPAAARAA
ncbi:MAG TPA: glutathione S-transferase C-terminal domain-containing protein [Geminicoccaceae bacterium]|nr:glutathione S-transferase C-terminal domain-containing protein [Geminicoccaceae bacterium]